MQVQEKVVFDHSALVNKSQLTSYLTLLLNEFHLPKEHWVVNVILWCTTMSLLCLTMFYNSEYLGHLIDVIGPNTLQ